jgi:hypothetical protein
VPELAGQRIKEVAVSDATVVHGQNCICHLCQPSGVSVVRQVAAAGPRCSDRTHASANRPTRPQHRFRPFRRRQPGSAPGRDAARAVYSNDVELISLPAPNPTHVQRSTSILRAA